MRRPFHPDIERQIGGGGESETDRKPLCDRGCDAKVVERLWYDIMGTTESWAAGLSFFF